MSEEKKDIKNSKELVKGAAVVVKAIRKALEDHKINGKDLPLLLDLAKEHQVLVDAVVDVDEVIKEIKDLDGEEAKQLLAELMAAFAKS